MLIYGRTYAFVEDAIDAAVSRSLERPEAILRIRGWFPEVATLSEANQARIYNDAVQGAIREHGEYAPEDLGYMALEKEAAAYQLSRYHVRKQHRETLKTVLTTAGLGLVTGLIGKAKEQFAAEKERAAAEAVGAVESSTGLISATGSTDWAAERAASLARQTAAGPETVAAAGAYKVGEAPLAGAFATAAAETALPWYKRAWRGLFDVGLAVQPFLASAQIGGTYHRKGTPQLLSEQQMWEKQSVFFSGQVGKGALMPKGQALYNSL